MAKKSELSLPWVEKYRPKKPEHVIGQREIMDKICALIEDGSMLNYLLSGDPGTGKTTISFIIANLVTHHEPDDMKYVNASMFGREKFLEKEIIPWCRGGTIGTGKKCIILDEFDGASKAMQNSFRRVMEEANAFWNCIFVLTCNYIRNIIGPIQSRCSKHTLTKVAVEDLVERGKFILEKEGVEYADDDVEMIALESNGQVRDFITSLQDSTIKKKLVVTKKSEIKLQISVLLKYILKGDLRNVEEALRTYYDIKKTLSSNDRDILLSMHEMIIANQKMPPELKGKIVKQIAETDFRLTASTDPSIQMSGLIITIYYIATPYVAAKSQNQQQQVDNQQITIEAQ